MKSVVVTGSGRGLGFELAKEFRKNNYNVVICDISKKLLDNAKKELLGINSKGDVLSVLCDVSKYEEIEKVAKKAISKFDYIDIWINNAGVNQSLKNVWDVSNDTIEKLVDIDLKGVMYGCKVSVNVMLSQGFGQIYSIEGHGSNNAIIPGLSIYGTCKHGVTYYMKSLHKELDTNNINVSIGLLSPGIMLTDFLTNNVSGKDELPDKTKSVYNILGDYPDVIAKYMVSKIITNNKKFVKINWLTNRKAFVKFLTSSFNKKNFFN